MFWWYAHIFPARRLYYVWIGLVVFLGMGYAFPFLVFPSRVLLFVFIAAILLDGYLLFRNKRGVIAERILPAKFSNGDENPVEILLTNTYALSVNLQVIDEAPKQFQLRDNRFMLSLQKGQSKKITYTLRPVKRGEYVFGKVRVFTESPIGLLRRRQNQSEGQMVPVYPSFLQMRKYEIIAFSDRLRRHGLKKIRRIGHSLEFEQIKEYVRGDDYRTINWKATARENQLMANHYRDERSQDVYCIIDKGRLMQMPFEGMSLLDYAINASLVLANVSVKKNDKAGLVTFGGKMSVAVPASDNPRQVMRIQEALFNQLTNYPDANYEVLTAWVRKNITHQSLLLLFTNFESLQGAERQLKYLRMLARRHRVIVFFFQNTELVQFSKDKAKTLEQIYQKTIAGKFVYEKEMIVKRFQRNGIQAIQTTPQNLTINALNKYLEMKARGL